MPTVLSLCLRYADGTNEYRVVTKLPDEYDYIGPRRIVSVEAERVPVIEIEWMEAA